jgi:predicted amidohydrolase
VSKYRKVHLPGNKDPYPDPEMIDQLEKRYFEPGDYGFPVGLSRGLALA